MVNLLLANISLISPRLFNKFFTFEKINTFIFFSLNQNFCIFAAQYGVNCAADIMA